MTLDLLQCQTCTGCQIPGHGLLVMPGVQRNATTARSSATWKQLMGLAFSTACRQNTCNGCELHTCLSQASSLHARIGSRAEAVLRRQMCIQVLGAILEKCRGTVFGAFPSTSFCNLRVPPGFVTDGSQPPLEGQLLRPTLLSGQDPFAKLSVPLLSDVHLGPGPQNASCLGILQLLFQWPSCIRVTTP